MIKVQPSYSRILWSQSADRITLTMPRPGFLSDNGLMSFVALLWIGAAAFGFALSLIRGSREYAIACVAIALPGVVALLGGLIRSLRSWSVERDGTWLTHRQIGLFGSRTRRWPAADIASFYVREVAVGADVEEAVLRVGFRNGRHDDILRAHGPEELQWVAAMLMDPRGERRTSSPLILAAEPERRRVDPAIVPATLSCRTFEGGVEVSFQPLLRSKGLWWRLPLAALLGTVAIIGVAVLLHAVTHGRFPSVFPRLAIFALLGFTGWRMWVLQRWGRVRILDGIVTVTQGKDPIEFGVGDVEFVQTYRLGRHTELQFLLKDKPKVRLLEGRPAPELEWAARFLRVAIKGRTAVPETAAMKVDAAAGDCQVCHEKMDSRVVYCAKCRTPHHEECWSYMGVCSTYGCREIRFERT